MVNSTLVMVMVKDAPEVRKAEEVIGRTSCLLDSPGLKSTSVGLTTKEADGF